MQSTRNKDKIRMKGMIGFFVFVSLIAFVYSLEYSSLLCGDLFCYLLSVDGTTTITNDNQPIHSIVVESAVDYKPDLTKTYFEKGGKKIVMGDEDFDMSSEKIGGYKKQWFFDFTASPKFLETGSYKFNTVFYNPNSPSDTVPYTYTYFIDRTPPTIDEIRLFEGIVDKSNTRLIKKGSDATIKVKASDNDGIEDSGVRDVWLCVDSCESNKIHDYVYDGAYYNFNIADPGLGWHTVYLYAEDDLKNLNDSQTYLFSVNYTKPRPIAPVLWSLPSETENQIINVVGYANESNVTVYLFATRALDEDPAYDNSEYITYDSNLIGVFKVIEQTGDGGLKVSKTAYGLIEKGDFVWFERANLSYFRRYEVVNKKSSDILNIYKIFLSPLVTQNIVGEDIFVYNSPYPSGWFNIPIELIPETKNYVLAVTEDTIGNVGDGSVAGPVYFHINPPVLYDVPGVVGEAEIEIEGYAKPGSIISISHVGKEEGVEKKIEGVECTDSDGGRDYYVEGTCESQHPYGRGPNTDYCLDENRLGEYFCEVDDSGGSYNGMIRCSGEAGILCPNGCQDGACIKEELIIADQNGEFSITLLLYSGLNSIYAKIVDQNGDPLSDKSNELRVYYDNEGPEIEITQPGLTTNKQNVEVRANLNDYSEIVKVDLLINDTPTYTYSEDFYEKEVSFFDVSSPLSKNGSYSILMIAEDRFGNSNFEEKEFILDTSMPDPAVFGLDGVIVNSSSPVLNFTFNQEVRIHSVEGVEYISINTTDNKTFLIITEDLDDGVYEVTIKASALKGGGVGTYTFNFIVDNTAPIVTIDGIKLIGIQYANITGACIDDNFGAGSISIFVDGSQFAVTNCEDDVYRVDMINLGEGRAHTITVRAVDLAGNSNFTSRVIDTGIPEVSVTNVATDDLIEEDGVYKTKKEKVTITGSYMDENFDGVEVLINGEPADYEINTYAASDSEGVFEINVTLLGNESEEFVNNIAVVVKDKSGLKDEQNIIVIKDFTGPTIEGFEPETRVVSNRTPTLKIRTNEYADLCKLEYPIGDGFKGTQDFKTEDHRNFVVSIITKLANTTMPQDLSIICNDSFSNVKTNVVPIVVDQVNPSIDEFGLVYNVEMVLWKEDINYKKYLIKELNTAEPLGAIVGLRVRPDEAARCKYYGSRQGVFANYKHLFDEMKSDKSHVLENGGEYNFSIICEDKAERLSEVKVIDVVINSAHPVTAPVIKLREPKTIIVATRSPAFEGLIISLAPDAPIVESELRINGTIYDLELENGEFSETIGPLPADGEYLFVIFASNSKGNSTTMDGSIIVDTTGPGACVKVGDEVYCMPAGREARGVLADLESDYDSDGLPDVFEYKHFNCITCAEPDEDSDGDGVTNLVEYQQNSTPVKEVGSLGGPGGVITVNS